MKNLSNSFSLSLNVADVIRINVATLSSITHAATQAEQSSNAYSLCLATDRELKITVSLSINQAANPCQKEELAFEMY